MLLIDDRIGSRDLLQPLLHQGVQCELARLQAADFAFIGRGVGGADVFIGIELKRTQDLISSMHSSRFAGHQLPLLQRIYDRVWLVTEGLWRANNDGVLETLQGGWRMASHGSRRVMARDVDAWLLTQAIRGGVSHWHCNTGRDTLRFVSTLYKWWINKAFEDHRSHEAIYLPPPDRAMLTEPSPVLKMLSCLPHVGWDKAQKLAAHCHGSMVEFCTLSATDLQRVPGIGAATAEAIRNALQGR